MKFTNWVALLLVCFASVSHGQGLLVDQSYVNQRLDRGVNLKISAPIGQEFTPTLNGINAVEFLMGGANLGQGHLAVNLRDDSITGPILGTSATNYLGPLFKGTTKFEFPNVIPVVPGDRYVFEIRFLPTSTDPTWFMWVQGRIPPESRNPGGAFIEGGQRQEATTALFREGLILNRDLWLQEQLIPEPSSVALMLTGLAFIAAALRRRSNGSRL
jgi:hypothetical protein